MQRQRLLFLLCLLQWLLRVVFCIRESSARHKLNRDTEMDCFSSLASLDSLFLFLVVAYCVRCLFISFVRRQTISRIRSKHWITLCTSTTRCRQEHTTKIAIKTKSAKREDRTESNRQNDERKSMWRTHRIVWLNSNSIQKIKNCSFSFVSFRMFFTISFIAFSYFLHTRPKLIPQTFNAHSHLEFSQRKIDATKHWIQTLDKFIDRMQ